MDLCVSLICTHVRLCEWRLPSQPAELCFTGLAKLDVLHTRSTHSCRNTRGHCQIWFFSLKSHSKGLYSQDMPETHLVLGRDMGRGSILFAPETRFRGSTETRTCSFCIFGVPEPPHILRLCGSVSLLQLLFKFRLFCFFFGCFGLCTHFEIPALRNSSCHWSVKLLGDDLHLERQPKCRLQTKKKWQAFSANKDDILSFVVNLFVWILSIILGWYFSGHISCATAHWWNRDCD